jgi:hypothetical protein
MQEETCLQGKMLWLSAHISKRALTWRSENSKAIAVLFKTLSEKGLLTEDQLDEILLDVTW